MGDGPTAKPSERKTQNSEHANHASSEIRIHDYGVPPSKTVRPLWSATFFAQNQ